MTARPDWLVVSEAAVPARIDEYRDVIASGSGVVSMPDGDEADGAATSAGKPTRRPAGQDLAARDSVRMTVLAQDPTVTASGGGPMLAQVEVPAERLAAGPRGHRFHVVDMDLGTSVAQPPLPTQPSGEPWLYADPWARLYRSQSKQSNEPSRPGKVRQLAETIGRRVREPRFRKQNVFAIAAATLALFERNLGRPIAWRSGLPHLHLVPAARVEANAFYSPEHNAVRFGWLPAFGDRPSIFTSLSYDVITHEVSHAILDGLRPRFTEPGLPDQLAFHEALADIVAMLSVFQIDGVPDRLLASDQAEGNEPGGAAPRDRFAFPGEPEVGRPATPSKLAERRAARAQHLMRSPLSRLAEQLGTINTSRRDEGSPADSDDSLYPSLRRAVALAPNKQWRRDPSYDEPHRRADVLVAALMQSFVDIWVNRLDSLENDHGLDRARMVEEGTKAAQHLLGMILRSLDYLPPVDLEFNDVIDSIITADRRLAPDDPHDYRGALGRSFDSFGIKPPRHRILDEDGVVAPGATTRARSAGAGDREPSRDDDDLAEVAPDPDTTRFGPLRYEHLNYAAMRTSPEEIYQFIWNNAGVLDIDVRLTTVVERVLTSTRSGPDGLIVTEVLADYTQRLRGRAGDLPSGIERPEGMSADTVVEIWGGGVLVFDQFGRFRLHQRKPIMEKKRQTDRLAYLFTRAGQTGGGVIGASDGMSDSKPFELLHGGAWNASR